jgi:hypothetical protein
MAKNIKVKYRIGSQVSDSKFVRNEVAKNRNRMRKPTPEESGKGTNPNPFNLKKWAKENIKVPKQKKTKYMSPANEKKSLAFKGKHQRAKFNEGIVNKVKEQGSVSGVDLYPPNRGIGPDGKATMYDERQWKLRKGHDDIMKRRDKKNFNRGAVTGGAIGVGAATTAMGAHSYWSKHKESQRNAK